MASSSQVAVAALAAVGCTAFVAAPSAMRGPALRSTAQGQAKASSTSGTGLAICGLGAAVGAAIAAPKKERVAKRAFETARSAAPSRILGPARRGTKSKGQLQPIAVVTFLSFSVESFLVLSNIDRGTLQASPRAVMQPLSVDDGMWS